MVTTWLLTHGGSQVYSRGHKLGDRIQRTDVARTRLCCAAGTVPGVSLASCSLTFAAAIWEGGGISDVLPVKKNLGAEPPAIPVTRSSMSSSWPWFLCLLAVSPLLF